MKHNKLTETERKLICKWKALGWSNISVAEKLGRDTSTIGRELKRNKFKGKVYEPLHAQSLAQKRKAKAWNAKKHLKNRKLFAYIISHLREGWSPEQIAGRLKFVEHPNDPSWHICHETIYAFIYSGKWTHHKDEPLFEYLRRKQKRRQKKGGRSAQKVRIPDRVSIHQRPEEVAARVVPGHWEGDTVVGRNHKTGLHTEYERVTSLTRIIKLNAINSEETIKAQFIIFKPLPKQLRRSTTLDNGLEMAKHKRLSELDIQTYFADPYSSWQRGGNENTNLWVRYYFPKKTDFTPISPEEIKEVEKELNTRPRKRLKYLKPIEAWNILLKDCDRS